MILNTIIRSKHYTHIPKPLHNSKIYFMVVVQPQYKVFDISHPSSKKLVIRKLSGRTKYSLISKSSYKESYQSNRVQQKSFLYTYQRYYNWFTCNNDLVECTTLLFLLANNQKHKSFRLHRLHYQCFFVMIFQCIKLNREHPLCTLDHSLIRPCSKSKL